MIRSFRSSFVVLGTALLLWQLIIAPMTHASAAHVAVHATVTTSPSSANRLDHPQVTSAEARPCHEIEQSDVAPVVSVVSHHLGAVVDSDSNSPIAHAVDGVDCCDSVGCQCACVHASMNSVPFAEAALAVPGHPAELGGHLPVLGARIVELFKPPI